MNKLYCLIILSILISCRKDGEVNYYPDCFKKLTSSPNKTTWSCGEVFVAIQLDDHRMVSIFLNEQALDLKTKCKSFKVESDTNNIIINYYTFDNHPDSIYFDYCTDAILPPGYYGSKTTWKAVSGIVTAVVSKEKIYRRFCESCYASIELDNIKFIKENSTQDTTIFKLIATDKWVGYCIP